MAIVRNGPAVRAAREAPRGELRRYGGLAHLEIYIGEGFERLAADQVAVLSRNLLGQNNPS
jgi:uncharacterized protein